MQDGQTDQGGNLSTHLSPNVATTVDLLRVCVHADAAGAGTAAAAKIAEALRSSIAERGRARIIFAAAPSQDDTLAALANEPGIDWPAVTAFQMDEYVGLGDGHPRAFGSYLDGRIYQAVLPGQVHTMHPEGSGTEEAERYGALLTEDPIDVVCFGIGENGHLAFNDPGVADRSDPLTVKVVTLDETSRKQQVNDGCFPALEDVPVRAITATIPALLSGATLVGTVITNRKRAAVTQALYGPIDIDCPASTLREHSDASLYLDLDAAPDALAKRH